MSKSEVEKEMCPISRWLKKEILNRPLNSETIHHSRNFRSRKNIQYQEEGLQESLVEKESDIENLSPIKFQGRIHFVNDFFDLASICDILLNEINSNNNTIIPVGFDLEWTFSFQSGSGKTALVQICLSEKACYLLHLYDIKKLPTSLIVLLSHPKVKLVGVNIKNDVRKLARDFKEFPGQKVVDNNCLDCGPYANRVFNRSGRWSLQGLTAFLLKKKISKDPSVRISKWHIQPLTKAQKVYAATDAYISLRLYLTIEQRKERLAQIKEMGALEPQYN